MSTNLILRKSCYKCKYTKRHISDITLADFWGCRHFDPSIKEEKGFSSVLENTSRGKEMLDAVGNAIQLEQLNSQLV